MIVIYLCIKLISPDAIRDCLVRTLSAEAVAYSTVTKSA
jgi:hypothetical protein